jgi:regulator of protease activity HflC (stomatin/prohibitin superfamily)
MFRYVTINEDERGLLIHDGRFDKLLEPGRHRLVALPTTSLRVERFAVKDAEMTSNWARIIEKNRPELAARLFEIVSVGEGEVAIVSFDGRPTHLLGPWKTRYYWKVLNEVSTEYIDTRSQYRAEKKHANAIDAKTTTLLVEHTVGENEAGLLYIDGVLTEKLQPGRHAFWQVDRKVQVARYDLRPLPIEITAQEILTRDRVALRVTLTAYCQVTDPETLAAATNDHNTYVYRLVQFGVREAIASRKLDEILNNRDTIDSELRTYVESHIGDIGVRITELGVKDVILPGDMRELINKVVEAEKVAQANLIRRQEETAATRSLLNTAKLMENNPILMRLKEIEALEKLTEKVGRIDLHAGESAGLDALMTKLLTLKANGGGDGGSS